jgi:hypothetical protein
MSNLFFQRSWKLWTSRQDRQQLMWTSDNVEYPYVPNRLVFKCTPFSEMGTAAFMEMKIYNLSENEKNNILENDDIFLELGYVERGRGLAFSGKVQSFNGYRIQEGDDFNYVFVLYCVAYSGGSGDQFTPTAQSLPQTIDLSENYVPAPFTVGNQALAIGRKFGYQPSSTGISPSISNTPAFPMTCKGANMNMLLSDFTDKTGYYLTFDVRDHTYTLLNSNPTSKNYFEFANKGNIIRVDRNNGLVGYPTYDISTAVIKFTRLIDTDIDLLKSTVSVDVTNTILTSYAKKTTQFLTTQFQRYVGFVVCGIFYEGDTRGDPWYQHILAWGTNK